MKKAKTGLGYQRSSVVSQPCNRLCDPGRISCEEVVILWCAKKSNDAQLDDEVIDNFLRLYLRENTGGQVALKVNIKKGRRSAQRHGSTVLLFYGCQVAEIEPLHRLLCVASGNRDIEAIAGGHLLQFVEGTNLFAEFFSVTNAFIRGHGRIEAELLFLLVLNEARYSVERYAAVVPDDAASPVGIRKSRQNVRASAASHIVGVCVEDGVIVSLPVLRERFYHRGIGFVSISLERVDDHPKTTVGHDCPLEWRLGLKSNDHFVTPIDIARIVGGDGTWNQGNVEHALFSFFHEEFVQAIPKVRCACGGARKEGIVSLIRLVVLLNEVADIDLPLPKSRFEVLPRGHDFRV